LISFALGESDAMPRKPAPDMVFAAMRQLGVTDAYYIGDSDVDVLTARNAALPCLAVSWGFRTVEQLRNAGATEIYATPQDLLQRIQGENA
jgi:phosphoglycolate phosphatase